MKWEPGVISRLFLDRRDYEGILYWFDVALELIKIRNKKAKQRN